MKNTETAVLACSFYPRLVRAFLRQRLDHGARSPHLQRHLGVTEARQRQADVGAAGVLDAASKQVTASLLHVVLTHAIVALYTLYLQS